MHVRESMISQPRSNTLTPSGKTPAKTPVKLQLAKFPAAMLLN